MLTVHKVKEEGAAKFDENKGKWQQMVTDIFDKGGFDKVLKLVGIQNSASYGQILSIITAPLFYMIFVR
uniref:Uncharacterized protein n=1 Tax=Caenorhabditis japonica TaxID=281687 RepID=A0A8R1ESA5_CAEJA